jgi:hypothetical protein
VPQSSPKISYVNPKDTTLIDSLRIVFHYQIDNPNQERNILQWHFSDGTSDTSLVSLHFFAHTFPDVGVYKFSVLLLDTISKIELDSVSGTIRILETFPALSKLQQMKHVLIQVYCPINESGTYLFTGAESISWIDDTCIYSFASGTSDTSFFQGFPDEITAIGSGSSVRCVLSNGRSSINSVNYIYNTYNIYDKVGRSTESAHQSEHLEIDLNSVPWMGRITDSLIYQASGSQLRNIIYEVLHIAQQDQGGYPIGTNYNYSGPNWNSPDTSTSYARIVFYK